MPDYNVCKLRVNASGPVVAIVNTHASFRAAWSAAMRMIDDAQLSIVGCHLDDDERMFKYAEFFVVGQGIYETYIIREAEPIRKAEAER